MKITDINKTDLPIRVKLTEAFTLEESFDPGMIVQINNYRVDWMSDGEEACYEVFVTALASDYEHNNSVAIKDWLDNSSNPTLSIFESIQARGRGDYNPEKHNWQESIYVMENDEAFELIEPLIPKREKLETIVYNIINDARDKWSSNSEEENGVTTYVLELEELINKFSE